MQKSYIQEYFAQLHGVGLDLVETHPITYEIEIIEETPQQIPGSLDCGIILCYVMRQLFENKNVTTEFDAIQGRADLITELLHTPERSWTLESHHKWTADHNQHQ